MKRTGLATAFLGCSLAAGCGSPPPATDGGEDRVVPLGSPAAPGSAEPNLVAGADGGLYLSWIEPEGDGHALRFSAWEGDGWTAARTVAAGDDWFVNWADFPALDALADGTLAAHWRVRSAAATYAYDTVLSVSTDGGAHWSAPVRAHEDGTPTEHGFASLVPLDDAFLVVWLDGRQTAERPPGPMTLRQARLGRDGRIGPSGVVDEAVCDCCATDAGRTDDGVVVVYRDRRQDEVRDVYATRRVGETWSAPAAVHDDGWVIAGCPVNGPAVAAAGSRAAAAWFSGATGDPGTVRLAFSGDGGRSFAAPWTVDDGHPLGRVDVVLSGADAALVSWLEQVGDDAELRVRRVTPAGGDAAAITVARTGVSRASGFPKMVRHGDDVFFAWTVTGDPSRVATARLPGIAAR